MQHVLDGVQKFQGSVYPSMQARFRELAGGQSPDVFFIACSDSRVDPSLITQTGPGELFVLRNAGNAVTPWGIDRSIDAAVEYAVAVLGVGHVVICGHSGCGAVGGAASPEGLSAVPSVKDWVKHVGSTVPGNVSQQIANLRTHPCVKAALAEGKVELHGWVYDIGSGGVETVAGGGPS